MQHILITGSTDGIGKLATVKLAKEGHRLYVHGRNPEKVSKVVSDIQEETQNDNIIGVVADLSDLKSIEQAVATVAQHTSHLDVLINNAGVFKAPQERTPEGHDIRFVVNYLAPMVLTQALLPLLSKASAPRVINLSSAAQAPVSLPALQGEAALDASTAYAQSKLALTMWSFDLSEQQEFLNVIAVNPGSLLNTNMVSEAYGHHWSSADKGAEVLYQLATSADFAKAKKEAYFDNDLSARQGSELGAFNSAHADAYNLAKRKALQEAAQPLLPTA